MKLINLIKWLVKFCTVMEPWTMNNPGQPLLTDTMVDHSITMVKPCLTIVKTNHASPILQKMSKPWLSMV